MPSAKRRSAARSAEEARFRAIFERLHADHATCLDDEWLNEPCRSRSGKPLARPIVWSRRNGPWHRVDIMWLGAAPGNAGGRGRGPLGAHGTRIPFGGDIAGANLEVLFGSIGLDRNRTFITAALNQLPASGGGEPTIVEMFSRSGRYRDSVALARDTIVACGSRLLVCLGNLGARVAAAATSDYQPMKLPGTAWLNRMGWQRNSTIPLVELPGRSEAFLAAWREAWGDAPLPVLLWLTHPSAQNMSPFAGTHTVFHRRVLEARDALRAAAKAVLGITPPAVRPDPPVSGIYALPEWRERIAPRNAELDRLWRAKGV